MSGPNRGELNVSGDFFIDADCCTSCGMCETIAPDLIDWGDVYFVKKQPETINELEQMMSAIEVAMLDCIIYSGTEKNILMRLYEEGKLHIAEKVEEVCKVSTQKRVYFSVQTKKCKDFDGLFSLVKSFCEEIKLWGLKGPVQESDSVCLSYNLDFERTIDIQFKQIEWASGKYTLNDDPQCLRFVAIYQTYAFDQETLHCWLRRNKGITEILWDK